MKVIFYLRYTTQYGESCQLCINGADWIGMEYLNEDFWTLTLEFDPKETPDLNYQYGMLGRNGVRQVEWEKERIVSLKGENAKRDLILMDYWNPVNALENTFLTQPFTQIFNPPIQKTGAKTPKHTTHHFRVKSPMLKKGEVLCLLGHGAALRNWDSSAPILLERNGNWWERKLDLSDEDFPLAYKYGVWNAETKRFAGFESGNNRVLHASSPESKSLYVLHDGFTRFPLNPWKGAGVAIPVFSLRSEKSWGVGEFTDLKMLADWASGVGLRLIQLLPINDTTATHTWTDSYPYAAISAFALHPLYLNVEELAGKTHAAQIKPYGKKQKALNALKTVDYEAVLNLKWEIIRKIYPLQKTEWANDSAYKAYYEANKHWLAPYAAFCYLRDLYNSPDPQQWQSHREYSAAEVAKLLDPKSKHFDEVGIHLFVQWRLHCQLKDATSYAHQRGLAVKGDIPIGIYRYSCDAWVAPELYNMDKQAGAPPDDFAENGQNWGFPTYNWARMKEDGYAWWKQRFEQMSLYFDAFRIDHILGFFRIWSIPLDAVQGILGQFVPAIPLSERDFAAHGIPFDKNRYCLPYITEAELWKRFGEIAPQIAEHFLELSPEGRFYFREEYNSQLKVEQYFNSQEPAENHDSIKNGLFELLANVILLEGQGGYHFRFGIEKTSSYAELPPALQHALKALYVDYFYQKQDEFWQKEAMEKLPELKRGTDMLICGEDLGMVPHCVPDVMKDLSILSLEIQRMPKAQGTSFFHPKDAPYLSVVTPSTHDMSTLRGWWEEDRNLTQRFYNEVLQEHGTAPYFCEAWVNKKLLEQHFYSPAMWSIFQLQDLLGMDAQLRRENPNEERINVPANPRHYWRYRMHLTLEALQEANGFNAELSRMVQGSGRNL